MKGVVVQALKYELAVWLVQFSLQTLVNILALNDVNN